MIHGRGRSDEQRDAEPRSASVRRIVVLGGSSDLARSVLRELAPRGIDVVVLGGRHPAALERVAEELRALGVREVETVAFDSRAIDAHEALANAMAERLGTIDLVIVATGVLSSGELDELTPARVSDEITTNFTGLASAMTAFAKRMREQHAGRIVVFSTAAAIRVRRANFVYGASKAGLDGFSQGLQDVLADSGVGVTIVRPGFVSTKMTAGLPGKMPMSTTTAAVGRAVVAGIDAGDDVVWVPPTLRYVMPIVPHVPRSVWRRLPR
ncbi:MAG: SDR family NAD(P)-dependent oxidoreductase [Acidimicrobiales bacterium]